MLNDYTTLLIYPKGADYKSSQEQREMLVYRPSQVQLNTTRECVASTLTGTIPNVGTLFPEMGSRVQLLAEDGVCVFAGNLFKAEVDRWGTVTFTAYDQLRYLRGDVSGRFTGWEVSSVIRHILDVNAMPVGVLYETGVKLLKKLVHAECCLDVIQQIIDIAECQSARQRLAMEAVASGAGDIYVFFYDPLTGVCFMPAAEIYPYVMKAHNKTSTLIGEGSLATEFSYSLSIDDDTFNSVALFRPADDYAGAIPVLSEDIDNIDKWGRLRYFEQCSDAACANKAQLQLKADLILKWKNRPTRQLSVTAIGVPGLRAGMLINVSFPSYERLLGKTSKSQKMLLTTCNHTWEDGTHMMDLSMQTLASEVE